MDFDELANTEVDLGDGLVMRPVRETDVDTALELITRNYDHLRVFMEWAKPDYSRKDAEEWIAGTAAPKSDALPVNLCLFRGDEMIGTIGMTTFDLAAGVTEIGYWIDAGEEGKGIISRATEKVRELAFDRLGLRRVQICCADANVRSAAIPRKFGFVEEGRQRQHVMRDGKVYDFLIFGLLRDEWLSRRDA